MSFRFAVGDLEFRAARFDSMVVSKTTVTYQGSGTLNGSSGYRFALVADDGDASLRGDTVRVRIWKDGASDAIYDTQPRDDLGAPPTTPIAAGDIQVHI
jgi:hypothetical protein